jgi:hypothetical protein
MACCASGTTPVKAKRPPPVSGALLSAEEEGKAQAAPGATHDAALCEAALAAHSEATGFFEAWAHAPADEHREVYGEHEAYWWKPEEGGAVAWHLEQVVGEGWAKVTPAEAGAAPYYWHEESKESLAELRQCWNHAAEGWERVIPADGQGPPVPRRRAARLWLNERLARPQSISGTQRPTSVSGAPPPYFPPCASSPLSHEPQRWSRPKRLLSRGPACREDPSGGATTTEEDAGGGWVRVTHAASPTSAASEWFYYPETGHTMWASEVRARDPSPPLPASSPAPAQARGGSRRGGSQ